MNTASFIGWLSSTVLARYLCVPNMIIILYCSVLPFDIIGVHTVVGVVVFGNMYVSASETVLAHHLALRSSSSVVDTHPGTPHPDHSELGPDV